MAVICPLWLLEELDGTWRGGGRWMLSFNNKRFIRRAIHRRRYSGRLHAWFKPAVAATDQGISTTPTPDVWS